MPGPVVERRQGPRVQLNAAAECRLEVRTRVRLRDISLTGVLLATEIELPVGARAQLRCQVAGVSCTPSLTVRRVADPSGRGASHALGAMFTGMDDRSKRCLEDFLQKASS